jgi:hypothetical protein
MELRLVRVILQALLFLKVLVAVLPSSEHLRQFQLEPVYYRNCCRFWSKLAH